VFSRKLLSKTPYSYSILGERIFSGRFILEVTSVYQENAQIIPLKNCFFGGREQNAPRCHHIGKFLEN